ncbi:THAP domain-containing protein [Phthorimaea operculella]|nr:THAP domain-containing protein [Phthorimaea operculella]
MPACAFAKCPSHPRNAFKANGISYHRFPSDTVHRLNWIAVVRKQRCEDDWMPTKTSRICSNHFKNDDKYTSQKGLLLLKKDAVPIIEKHAEEEPNSRAHTPSASSLDNVSIPDEAEIFESPRKAALKETIHTLKFEKNKLQYKNKVLTQQIKRLKKKIAKMSTILKILKKRDYISNEQFTELNLKAEVMDLFNRIYCKKTKKKLCYRKKYPPALRKFALSLKGAVCQKCPFSKQYYSLDISCRILKKIYVAVEDLIEGMGHSVTRFDEHCSIKKKSKVGSIQNLFSILCLRY